jgi:hypothetical protein
MNHNDIHGSTPRPGPYNLISNPTLTQPAYRMDHGIMAMEHQTLFSRQRKIILALSRPAMIN